MLRGPKVFLATAHSKKTGRGSAGERETKLTDHHGPENGAPDIVLICCIQYHWVENYIYSVGTERLVRGCEIYHKSFRKWLLYLGSTIAGNFKTLQASSNTISEISPVVVVTITVTVMTGRPP